MRLSLAATCLLVTTTTTTYGFSFTNKRIQTPSQHHHQQQQQRFAASLSADADAWPHEEAAIVEADSSSMIDTDQEEIEEKQRRVQERQNAGRFRLNFALTTTASGSTSSSHDQGITLMQVDAGRQVLERELSLENLQISKNQQQQQDDSSSSSSLSTTTSTTSTNMMERVDINDLPVNFRGVVVAGVDPASRAWAQGLRPGDILRSVSATLGNALWPKSTLEGVQSALFSRKVVSSWVVLEFERLSTENPTQLFELTLTKPLGFQIQETQDGYVQVSAIQENASSMVQYGLQVGDRVVAVDSSLGDKLWPVSTVEGVISACTSRLPGQSITFRFERPAATTEQQQEEEAVVSSNANPNAAAVATVETHPTTTITSTSTPNNQELISRCRQVLRRYSSEKSTKLDGVLPALVADKVLDALASASVALDSVTLSMIMKAYLSCQQPDQAIRVFEAATGFHADGSLTPVTTLIVESNSSNKNKANHILPSESALNLYTGTVLMQAHALRGDMGAVCRVLAALEGRSGTLVDGLEVAPWPWTGAYGAIQPDTQCYNVALAAAEKIGGVDTLHFAQELFEERMRDPAGSANNKNNNEEDRRPEKSLVTYNTLLSAFSNEGMASNVFRLFDEMTRAGVRPDQYTYSALVKVCTAPGDLQEVLYDMQERDIQPDVVIYNTMIKTLCAERKWSEATKLITEMESKGISPDSMTYGFLMNAMLQADKPDSCLVLFESACANERTVGLTQNVYLYTTAITAASVLGDYERALELVSRMTANGVKPNLRTLTSVVGACLKANKYDLAVQVYERLEEPDGYAVSQGMRAYCGLGDFETAASLLRNASRRGGGSDKRRRMMSGKQIMFSYKHFSYAALRANEYEIAREMLADLLKKGFIPSAAILSAITDAFELNLKSIVEATEEDEMRFQFLLFVLDSMRQRNLPINGVFYASTLTLGRQIGGIQRRVANFLVQARNGISKHQELLSENDNDDNGIAVPHSWEEFLQLDRTTMESTVLPDLVVRVAARDSRRVIRAEQSVLYSNKPSSSTRKNKKRRTTAATQQ